jgi:RNA polymerase sigma-70 factor (ECF subfamily)
MDNHTLLRLIHDCIDKQSAPCSALYKFILSITSSIAYKHGTSLSKEDIEDIIQIVDFKLTRSGLSRFSGKTIYEFIAYLKRITVNEINSLFREQKMAIVDYTDDVQADPDTPSDNDPLDSRELMQKAHEVLKDYGPEEREAFFMHIMGYKYEEISQQLNIPISTLATRFEVIKQKIRDKLK